MIHGLLGNQISIQECNLDDLSSQNPEPALGATMSADKEHIRSTLLSSFLKCDLTRCRQLADARKFDKTPALCRHTRRRSSFISLLAACGNSELVASDHLIPALIRKTLYNQSVAVAPTTGRRSEIAKLAYLVGEPKHQRKEWCQVPKSSVGNILPHARITIYYRLSSLC